MSTIDDTIEIHVTLLGEDLRLILPGDGWSFDEAKVAKQMSEGMAPAVIEANLLSGDPDAWLAVLRVSYMRAGLEFPSRQLAGEDLMSLMKQLADASREAVNARPPTNPSASESNGSDDSSAPDATASDPT